ncbi:DUF4278 domain-containing protein [Oculatella sp. FACHB-28]|uniref:DUF4278 domain-containing protein n=1 Tax=Oculatella sp. FACHB-28 TaxID=2692845 RepID=UPI0016872B61|nr:DUF4278 domain-containing protein [Oculatella sp. FACHB-28]MBD1868086.1 DUF4278 domain-containing protein [Cyanobacteria bacterium FACHB-471]MBD2054484.1 DUF4278 domain-containing protein [Oculatella sp. FACHB-28]
MKLIYRGVTFNSNPASDNIHCSVQRNESPCELIYRGSSYLVDPATAVAKSTECELTYRGITYQVKRNIKGEVTAVTSFTNSPKRKTATNAVIQNAAAGYSVEM